MPFVFFQRKGTGHSGKFPLVVKDEGGRLGKRGAGQRQPGAGLKEEEDAGETLPIVSQGIFIRVREG